MALVAGINAPLAVPFFVADIDGVTPRTGLVNADFTKTLFLGAVASAQPVVVSELGSGFYAAAFTPNAAGHWELFVLTPSDELKGCGVDAAEYHPYEALARIHKTLWNKLVVDLGAQELVLSDDDGVTPFQRWPLETDGGEPVATQPGVQTKRMEPLL